MSLMYNLRSLLALRLLSVNKLHTFQRSLSVIKGVTLEYDEDPQHFFTDPETQKLLQSMTQIQLDKVFRKRCVPDNSAEYKFMTNEQLEAEFIKTVERARKRLQMPPIVKVKKDTQRIISQDSALKDFSDTKFVITDITYGLCQTERKVVVRQTDGTLEYAPLDVTKRMNQLYFPMKGRSIRLPRMFEDEHLKRCLEEQKYEFILDRLTVQFEPFEPEFHRISSLVYQHVNETKQFDQLRSTRHFGPMAFFYVWHRCIDDLLYDMIRRDYLRNGVELIALLYKKHNINVDYGTCLKHLDEIYGSKEPALEELLKPIRPATEGDKIQEEIKKAIGKTPDDFEADDICMEFIERYIKEHALKKVSLELAVQTLKEINAEKKQLYKGLIKAHGIQ